MNIDASTLAAAVRTVLPATRASANHLPVLKGVRLAANSGVLDVTATDIDLTIRTTADSDDDLEPCIVPASLLSTWLEGVEGRVGLNLEEADLVLTSDTGTFRLRTLPVEDWPRCTVADGKPVKLDRRIAGIIHAASRDDSRPTLNGVGIGDGWACCTDSYRLAAVKLDGLPEAIVPVKAVELALKTDGEVTITTDDHQVTLTNGPTSYTARLVEGRFPNWQPLVGEPKTTVTLDRDRTVAALERVLVLADAETPVRVTPDGDGLTFSVTSRDVGEIVERIDGGNELGGEYGFRPRLLIAMLRSRDEAKVEIGVTDSLHPVTIRDETSVALVMPVRLS